MKLKSCLEIGEQCGLTTIGEAVFNIDLHATNIFDYSKINEELNELINERDALYVKTGFTSDSNIKDVLLSLE